MSKQLSSWRYAAAICATALWHTVAHAQHSTAPVVGFLNGSSSTGYTSMVASFRDGLKELGYIEGQNVVVEFRWANGHYDQLKEMALDLVNRSVSVIAANTPANLVVKTVTTRIPIVFTTSSDPVAVGLVDSMSRPSGNVTGVSQLNVEVGAKRLEIGRELLPAKSDIALLVNPDNPQHEAILEDAKKEAANLGLRLHILHATTSERLSERSRALPT